MDKTNNEEIKLQLTRQTLNYLYNRVQMKPKQIAEMMQVSIENVMYALVFHEIIGQREEAALWIEYNDGNLES